VGTRLPLHRPPEPPPQTATDHAFRRRTPGFWPPPRAPNALVAPLPGPLRVGGHLNPPSTRSRTSYGAEFRRLLRLLRVNAEKFRQKPTSAGAQAHDGASARPAHAVGRPGSRDPCRYRARAAADRVAAGLRRPPLAVPPRRSPVKQLV